MNNKGQTLVIFVLLLPLFILLFACVIDASILFYEEHKLNNINQMVIEYKMYHIEANEEKVEEYIKKNDQDVHIEKITMDDEKVEIFLSKEVKSLFGQIIGLKHYDIQSSYRGLIDKKEIQKIEE